MVEDDIVKKIKDLKNAKENSSSGEKQMDVVAMYSGLISHSDTSDDEEEKSKTQNDAIADENEQEEDVSEEEKEVAGEFDEDPDFMASDSPPDEFQSVIQEE